MDIEPAAVPGVRPSSTMSATLYGTLVLHPWRGPVAEADAYFLFYARSSAMGWLTEAWEGAVGGFWGMNEAEVSPNPELPPSCAAYFQVTLTNLMPGRRLAPGEMLPLQPFLACTADTVGRIGTLDLQAVQVHLPVEALHASVGAASPRSAVGTLISDAGWFADVPPRSRAPVQVTLNGGPNPAIRSAAPEMFKWMQSFRQEVFVCDSFSVSDDEARVPEHDPFPAWWKPGPYQATFHGTLVEWSLNAIGWL
ncbi:hypothetical protein, partial [Nitrolancea hollandica]|uniref:hypothetical protein n=1 Tax=Nitrolancea hollandica TaxID=1206749 RepID=UPI000687F74C